ncbi:hypothetical protein D3C76_352490 [compost metagenome]
MAIEVRMGQQRQDHGRHQQRLGDPFPLDHLQHLGRVETRQQHMAFTGHELNQCPSHAGDMEQRRHVQQSTVTDRRHVDHARHAR